MPFDSDREKRINLKALVESSASKEIVNPLDSLLCTAMLKHGIFREIETSAVNTLKRKF